MMPQDTSAEESALLLLPLLSRFLAPEYARQLHLTKTQLLIVTALSYRGSLNMSQIASYLAFSKEQATRAVAPLAEAGLVERFEQPENRTKVFLRLSPKGAQLADDLRAQFSSQLRARAQGALTEQELLQLRESAETLTRLLSKLS